MKLTKFFLTALFVLSFGVVSAMADSLLVGGVTQVTLTSAPTLTSLGLTVAPTGTATVFTNSSGIPVASFNITGNTPENLIFHDGSGLRFSAGGANLSISNFLINTATNTISGTVMVNGALVGNGIGLFNIGSGLTLTLSPTALGAIGSTFGLNQATVTALSTAVIGTARIIPASEVPEPGTLLLLLSGAAVAGPALRRRFARAKSEVA
ncbi:MAG TPA: PEP-CTERM sorting domain-containing protein [Blastocatellia bacterium]|nr:PEP-CTERM sorting domain-containing protein [Blastocatellia bacterium]